MSSGIMSQQNKMAFCVAKISHAVFDPITSTYGIFYNV